MENLEDNAKKSRTHPVVPSPTPWEIRSPGHNHSEKHIVLIKINRQSWPHKKPTVLASLKSSAKGEVVRRCLLLSSRTTKEAKSSMSVPTLQRKAAR